LKLFRNEKVIEEIGEFLCLWVVLQEKYKKNCYHCYFLNYYHYHYLWVCVTYCNGSLKKYILNKGEKHWVLYGLCIPYHYLHYYEPRSEVDT